MHAATSLGACDQIQMRGSHAAIRLSPRKCTRRLQRLSLGLSLLGCPLLRPVVSQATGHPPQVHCDGAVSAIQHVKVPPERDGARGESAKKPGFQTGESLGYGRGLSQMTSTSTLGTGCFNQNPEGQNRGRPMLRMALVLATLDRAAGLVLPEAAIQSLFAPPDSRGFG